MLSKLFRSLDERRRHGLREDHLRSAVCAVGPPGSSVTLLLGYGGPLSRWQNVLARLHRHRLLRSRPHNRRACSRAELGMVILGREGAICRRRGGPELAEFDPSFYVRRLANVSNRESPSLRSLCYIRTAHSLFAPRASCSDTSL